MIRVRFWGTRGSIVSPGRATQRYGGNTPCVEVIGFQGDEPGAAARLDNPRLILDGGTGLALLQDVLMGGPWGRGQGDLCFLLSHFHWDHVIGLAAPFKPIIVRGNRLTFYAQTVEAVQGSIERLFASDYSPVKQDLLAQLIYRQIEPSGTEIEGFHVRAVPNRHPGGALSFRLEYGGHAVVYSTDHECGDRDADSALIDLARGADVWVLDAMYAEVERAAHRDWGHSSPREAVELAQLARVRTVVLYHHDPAHDDEALDRMGQQAAQEAQRSGLEVHMAQDGMVMEVGVHRG